MKHATAFGTSALLVVVVNSALARDLIEIERSAELSLSDVTLPDSANDRITIRQCARCPSSTHRVSTETEYLLNGQPIPLPNLLAGIRALRGASDQTLVAISFDVATERVTRVYVVHR